MRAQSRRPCRVALKVVARPSGVRALFDVSRANEGPDHPARRALVQNNRSASSLSRIGPCATMVSRA
jgi:hypothetical protein